MTPATAPATRPGFLDRIPWKLMILTIAFSLWIEEFYPFSWFPMFTTLDKSTWYVFLTDGEDRKIPIEDEFGWTGDHTDNVFKATFKRARKLDAQMSADDALQLAAHQTLRRLLREPHWRERHADPGASLKVWRTDIKLVDGRLLQSDRELARLSAAEALAERTKDEVDDGSSRDDDDEENR
jgi:hypothetical protein